MTYVYITFKNACYIKIHNINKILVCRHFRHLCINVQFFNILRTMQAYYNNKYEYFNCVSPF